MHKQSANFISLRTPTIKYRHGKGGSQSYRYGKGLLHICDYHRTLRELIIGETSCFCQKENASLEAYEHGRLAGNIYDGVTFEEILVPIIGGRPKIGSVSWT